MFEKKKLEKKLSALKKEIETIDNKRSRSQAALVEAILTHSTPDDEDVEYFNRYTSQIDELRNEMHEVKSQLEALNK